MDLLHLACSLLQQFTEVTIFHVPRSNNEVANELAQQASSFRLRSNEVNNIYVAEAQLKENKEWRFELKQYLSNLSSKIEYKLNQKVSKYILVDDELFKRS